MSSQDPYYKIKEEISKEMESIEGSFLKLKGLQFENPKRKKIGQGLRKGCNDVLYQIGEIDKALDRAEKDPARYGLSSQEIGVRRKWASSISNQAEGYIQALKEDARQVLEMTNTNQSKQNNAIYDEQKQEQESLIRQQDEQLDELSEQVGRLGQIGIRIHEELNTQNNMLDELDQDVQVTTSRIKSAQVRIMEVINKSGSCRQFVCVIVLVVILIILIVLVFAWQ
eukprot:TRINITY_DN2121_c0_g1_i10.p2 TRINITY_DN2121_c0_g1~~TRINITY_DN2121_c0_g1_i10.p2  ORF type:complete len:226 (+),score=40.23 TRINITY_DN2121_c0_g1_i10:126-803(+)